MTEKELKDLKEYTIARLRNLTPIEIYKMIVSFHSNEGDACYNINDYINYHNLD